MLLVEMGKVPLTKQKKRFKIKKLTKNLKSVNFWLKLNEFFFELKILRVLMFLNVVYCDYKPFTKFFRRRSC